VLLRREFTFDAAHRLSKYHGKCERLHGHTYRLAVTLEGKPDEDGMLFDFVELKSAVQGAVLSELDHAYLNDIIDQPTAENIAMWIWQRLEGLVKRPNCDLKSVQVWETADCSATVEAGDMS